MSAPLMTWQCLFPKDSPASFIAGDSDRRSSVHEEPSIRIDGYQSLAALNRPDLTDEILRTAGFTWIRRYAVFPSKADPRWFIPLDSPAIAAGAFSLFKPVRTIAKLGHLAYRNSARMNLNWWRRDTLVLAQRGPSPLETEMRTALGGREVRLALSSGAVGTKTRKVSFAALDLEGNVLGFGKLAAEGVQRTSIGREANMLLALGKLADRGLAPSLLHAGEIDGAVVVLASPLPGVAAPTRIIDGHERLFESLQSRHEVIAGDTDLVTTLRTRASGDLLAALDAVLPTLNQTRVPATIVHGDFTPWNLRRRGDQILAFDWEQGTTDGLPLIDRMHHDLAVGYLLGRWSVDRADRYLAKLASSSPLMLTAPQVRAIQVVYIVDYVTRLLEAGHTPDDTRLAWYRRLLDRVMSAASEPSEPSRPSEPGRPGPGDLRTPAAPIAQLLHQFNPAAARTYTLQPLASGGQADLYSATAPDHPELIVKIYKPAKAPLADVSRDEFDALAHLNAQLDNAGNICGWTIHSPRALHRSTWPAGLIMTRVPGRPINHLLRDGTLDEQTAEELAEVIADAMLRFWSAKLRLYGDINLNNILCDPRNKTVSFVDPGMPERVYLCEGVGTQWNPASRDLAYLLFETAAAIKVNLLHPVARRRQNRMAEAIVRAAIRQLGGDAQRSSLLDELRGCMNVHLRRIDVSLSPGGLWRWFVRAATRRQLDRTIGRLA